MALDSSILNRLKTASDAGDRTKYYEILMAARDPYGALALGVVKQSTMSGRVARCYAIAVSARCQRPIDKTMWLKISDGLMRADFAARQRPDNYETDTPSLRWEVIQTYHVATFRDVAGLPPYAWTAWIPLTLQGADKDQKLWHRMLSEDFLSVAVQTVWLVAFAAAHRAGIEKQIGRRVIPTLASNPPLAGSNRKVDAGMRRLRDDAALPARSAVKTWRRSICRCWPRTQANIGGWRRLPRSLPGGTVPPSSARPIDPRSPLRPPTTGFQRPCLWRVWAEPSLLPTAVPVVGWFQSASSRSNEAPARTACDATRSASTM